MNRESEGKSSGIPHLAKNERDTRISCTWHQATSTCAAFIEESRIKFINANKLHRKSGGMGHPSFVWETKGGNMLRRFLAVAALILAGGSAAGFSGIADEGT